MLLPTATQEGDGSNAEDKSHFLGCDNDWDFSFKTQLKGVHKCSYLTKLHHHFELVCNGKNKNTTARKLAKKLMYDKDIALF